MFDQMNYEDFCELVDSEFQLTGFEENITLKLFEISEKKETPENICFSLLLRGNNDNILEQKIYHLKNEKVGEGELFIVPVGQDEDGIIYESVFNRTNEN